MYLRGDFSSFRLLFEDFFEDELLDDVDDRELRSLFEPELFDDDDDDDLDDFDPPLLLVDLLDDLDEDDDLVGEREFLCL